MKYYTVYRNGSDDVVAFGTAKECAEARGMTLRSFYSFISNTRSGRTKTYTVISEDVNEDEDKILEKVKEKRKN